jgi:hypothetical protein
MQTVITILNKNHSNEDQLVFQNVGLQLDNADFQR